MENILNEYRRYIIRTMLAVSQFRSDSSGEEDNTLYYNNNYTHGFDKL